MKYLYPKQVIYLHQHILEATGGSLGVRDKGLLESAIYRPQATFGGQDLYPDLFSKAAALGYSIIKNHPFIDGNKRIGYEVMRLFLRWNGYDIKKGCVEEKYALVMKIAEGSASEQQLVDWLKDNSAPKK